MKCNSGKCQSAPVNSRHGAFIIVVMVCLMIAAVLLGSLVKLALNQQRQLGREQNRLQAEWLADSGLERAAGLLAIDPEYAGEIWTIDAQELGGPDAARVVIRVSEEGSGPHARSVIVEAVYPALAPVQVRRTRRAIVAVPQES